MSECVVDASALVLALSGKSHGASALRARLATTRTHAPHLIDAEVGNVLRRHEREQRLHPDEARLALSASGVLIDHRHAHVGPLAELAWGLRNNFTFCDALYVALATSLGLPLLTADIRLSRAPAVPCAIETV
ncbi:MAG: type II toxin-antitoxin system VapC family toxin [Ornithinimicrobium sp.]